jgi:hypothetical protein
MDPRKHHVFGDQNIRREILLRINSTASTTRSMRAHKCFMEEIQEPDFASAYSKIQDPASIGFLVATGSGAGRITWLADTEDTPGDDTAARLRARISRPSLMRERVVGCRCGLAVVERSEGYFTTMPCIGEKQLSPVAPLAPNIVRSPEFVSSNTYGKFALMMDSVQGGIAFFVQDSSAEPTHTDIGVSCGSSPHTSVHLCLYSKGHWRCYATPQFKHPHQVIFNTNPTCIINNGRLFMQYIIGVIVTFRLNDLSFSHTALPAEVNNASVTDTDYAIGEHRKADLLLVHLKSGILSTYVLVQTLDEHTWMKISSTCLLDTFVSQFGMSFWQRLIRTGDGETGQTGANPLQLRATARNGSHVFITLADDGGYFVYDTKRLKLTEVYRGPKGKIGSVLTLTEPWPPLF